MKTKAEINNNIENLKKELDKLFELYYKTYPPGTLSKDGNFVMGNDGRWYGRCILIPVKNLKK